MSGVFASPAAIAAFSTLLKSSGASSREILWAPAVAATIEPAAM